VAWIGQESVQAFRYGGVRHDCSNQEGFLQAAMDPVQLNPELRVSVLAHPSCMKE
jgi:UTP-glucose-1-phosphate uridylyltransferase